MLRNVERDDGAAALGAYPSAAHFEPIVPAVADVELETPSLPHDHPRWVKDAIALSKAARDAIVRLRPIVIRVLTYWDHRLRAIVVAGRHVSVDSSGSYRAE